MKHQLPQVHGWRVMWCDGWLIGAVPLRGSEAYLTGCITEAHWHSVMACHHMPRALLTYSHCRAHVIVEMALVAIERALQICLTGSDQKGRQIVKIKGYCISKTVWYCLIISSTTESTRFNELYAVANIVLLCWFAIVGTVILTGWIQWFLWSVLVGRPG